jgi:hypothetical protein
MDPVLVWMGFLISTTIPHVIGVCTIVRIAIVIIIRVTHVLIEI